MAKLLPVVCVALVLTACGESRPTAVPIPGIDEMPVTNAKGDRLSVTSELNLKNWFTHSPEKDGVEGTQADRAYEELNVRLGVAPVVVAVIDSGLDISHEDLKDHLWVNPGEIPGNGIDDDHNGFVDDLHGWNFLGAVDTTTLELTRELVRMKRLKLEREAAGQSLTVEESKFLEQLATDHSAERQTALDTLDRLIPLREQFFEIYQDLKDELALEFEAITRENLEAFVPKGLKAFAARKKMLLLMEQNKVTRLGRIDALIERSQQTLDSYLNEAFDPRRDVLGDDPSDLTQTTGYGDAEVSYGDASHGTHVSGIIGAVRGNGLGIDGVAHDVRIMPIRAVPNGDEYDKDVANAVRYAVNQGARIINMSFGKTYSPHKTGVDAAFQYAADHGVLVVHAAGNSALNIDLFPHFPNPRQAGSVAATLEHWLTIGASTHENSEKLPAPFSNYGVESVDLFAPGVDILSTIPQGNQYASFSGTSMATPVVTGVAALVWSQYPALTVQQLKDVLVGTLRTRTSLPVLLPGSIADENGQFTHVPFGSLSRGGGLVDAYEALKRAAPF